MRDVAGDDARAKAAALGDGDVLLLENVRFEAAETSKDDAERGQLADRFAGVLKEIDERGAVFDFNHPLAGQRVRFEVRILGIL